MPILETNLDSAAERFIAPFYRELTEVEFQILCMASYARLIDGMAPGISVITLQDDLNSGARAYCGEWRRRLMDWGVRTSTDPLSR